MRKQFKIALLSTLIATATVTASTATYMLTSKVNAESATETTRFEMVDGAAIRLKSPYGLRFIAEFGSDVYDNLMKKETGVDKKMGMFIMPYSYLSDASKYSDGATGVFEKNYENITTKLDHVFYNSADNSVKNKIYQEGDYYRANGVVWNLKLKNFDRDFVGIAYIAETTSSGTTYTYAEFDEVDDVRNAAYVAVEAYEDYKDNENAATQLEEYILGAHFNTLFEDALVETSSGTGENKELSYEYDGTTYSSIQEIYDDHGDGNINIYIDETQEKSTALNIGDKRALNLSFYDGDNENGEAIVYNGVHAVWSSSNENVATVDKNGVVTAVGTGEATITASFMGASATCTVYILDGTFESNSTVPDYMSNKSGRIENFSIVEMNGSKVLQATTTAASTSDVGVFITTEVLGQIFADPDVDYMAFDLKSGATRTGNTVYYHGNGATTWTQYETGGYDSIPVDSFKTYYFPRSEYNNWVSKGVTSARFVMIGGSLVYGGESFYIDNLRPVTEEEKAAALYSFEYGGVRTNNGNSPLFYSSNSGSWELSFSNIDSTTAGFTSDIVSDGVRAFKFTKLSGDTAISFNHNTDTTMETGMRGAGYVSYDLYVPEGSDAKIVKNGFYSPLKEGWNTVYAKVDATANEWSRFTDASASTYVFDNIRFVTEEEYYEKAYGFESGAGVLRTAEIGEATANSGVFYYYGGADATATYSFAFIEGNGTNDVAAITNPRYDSTIKHSGNYSLAFDKGNGYLSVQMRNDSTAYSKLSGGFSFWIYSTSAINGTTANNFINGCNGKFNDGAGITIPANTWTQVFVTAADMNPTRFLIMQGSWTGTVYIDDIQPIDASALSTITYNANGGSITNSTQTVINGAEYTLATPTCYRDFLGWIDESGNHIPTSGVWNYGSNVTLTAIYSDKVSFENGIVPSYLTVAGSTESLSVVDMDTTDGNKALKIQSTASGTSPALNATVEFLASFFEDSNVDYIAFNAKTGSSRANNFRRYTMHSNGSMNNVTYEYDVAYNGVYADTWKTFYFSREDYNYWVANGVTSNSLIATGGFNAGDCIYLDNIRAATAEEYADGEYGFEIGGVRLDGNNLLFYTHRGAGTWQMGILPGAALTSYSYTNDIVSDGIRAFQFTPAANTTTLLRFNTNTTTQMQTDIMDATGYYAFDLYVPVGSDVTLTYQTTTYPGVTPKQGDWTTIYVNNNTTFIKITDTTGSTYAIDNFRSVTEDEYIAATLGFEANAGGLRDNVADSNVFYYYGGADHTANRYSICANGSPLESVRFDSEIVHSGDYSLAITKENGAITIQMRNDSTAYALLKDGFTFWIYSTVGINGISANNFINGYSEKFGESGISIGANTWTQVTVHRSDITTNATSGGACAFLRIQGSTAGTIYLDDFCPLPESEQEVLYHYNATVEEETDGVRKGILLDASTHTYASLDALPQDTADTEDMSYIKFNGSYGLNDFLVFDFTGNNVPLMSFFTSEVTNSVYNQEEDADMKGWIVANGMTTARGLIYSGSTSSLANRLNIIGPYKISSLYDNTTNNTLAQVRASEGNATSPSPITMPTLQASYSNTPFRMIVGWVENGSYMNLVMVVYNLSNGEEYLNYNLNKSIAKADWEGDIALYGHFGRKTYVDALYPIEEDKTIDEVVAKYKPTTLVYNGTWDGEQLTLAASTHVGSTSNIPLNSGYQEDMSYIAFKGTYGLNDYVVFDFTGDNFPFVSFFNTDITNTIFNFANDTSVGGWIIANGIKAPNGSSYGGDTGAHANRILFVGSNKISYRYDDNGSTSQWRTSIGSADSPSPIGMAPLKSVTDTYRAIIGYVDNGGNGAKARIYVINLVTGAVVVDYTQALAYSYSEGSIMLHGQFGTGTVLDKVFGVEEDTTLEALIAKYRVEKDFDYSDEEAVTLDRYAYSSLSDGQWTLDGTEQVTNPTDYRNLDSSYTTYKNAGFNILLAQDMIGTDGSKATWEASANKTYMDKAYAAGLKVILTDWHLQILSTPIKVSSSGAAASDSTYVPWIIGTDASATTGAAGDYLGYLSSLGITVDSTRFATRDALDKFVYDQLAPYKDHPAFYGVMLGDEPSYHNAYCYGEIYKSIKRVMPECYVQYNLLPLEHNFSTIQYRYPGVNSIGSGISNAEIETAYKSYVESFLDTMGTDYIQYDDYPFKSTEQWSWSEWSDVEDPYVDPTSLRNIQLMAEIAKERGLDVKVVSQSSVMKTGGESGAVHIRQITENDARWLNNYLMGFGVKQINYFTYWTKRACSSSGEYFVDGGSFVNRDGTTTALYTFMQTIMADNTKFAPTITHFDYNKSQIFGSNNDSNLNNEHISWSSSLTAAASFRWVTSVTTSLEYTLVTELYDKDNYNYMYMVMNTIDPNSGGTQSVTITLDGSVTKFYVYDQSGNRSLVEGDTYTVSLTAGQAVYIMPCAFE